jgi:hypothetical protein
MTIAVLMSDKYNTVRNPGKHAVLVFFPGGTEPERRLFPSLARAKGACDCINELERAAA